MDIKLKNQLLCSTIKVDKRFKYYGDAEVTNLSALYMIYDLISCNNVKHECLKKLENIAQKLINSSSDICNYRGELVFTDFSTKVLPIYKHPNNAPTIDNVSITFDNGEEVYTFSESQFKVNFTDINNDVPEIVRIDTLPTTGLLKYNNEIISEGFFFNIIDSGLLTYVRTNTQYTDTFNFQTSDNNITNKLFSNMATFTITVDGQINQPPSAVGDGSATTAYATNLVFTRAMFTTATTPPYSDPENDAADKLRINSLPTSGNIQLNAVNVLINDEINFTDIDAGNLIYVPDSGQTATHMPSFDFSIADVGSGQFTS